MPRRQEKKRGAGGGQAILPSITLKSACTALHRLCTEEGLKENTRRRVPGS